MRRIEHGHRLGHDGENRGQRAYGKDHRLGFMQRRKVYVNVFFEELHRDADPAEVFVEVRTLLNAQLFGV
ncbi:hypothetical protein SDC9_204308 [bioreactor metagenome]|uniref:Uncharacterized protein n=1 Tax=bioreactor metagenome TaxID=1076179 RepID=A0A645IYX2_9ZZZZ